MYYYLLRNSHNIGLHEIKIDFHLNMNISETEICFSLPTNGFTVVRKLQRDCMSKNILTTYP